jgi:hypothetical protein
MADPDDRDQGREEVLGKLRHLFTTGSGPGTDVDAREVLGAFEAEVRAAMEEKSKRSNRVWSELAILVGCTSPDGSAELGQVSYYQERAEAAEARVAALKAERERVEDNLQGVIRTVCQRVGEVAGVKVEGPAEAVQVVEEMAHYLADRDRLRAQVAELTEAWRTLSEASDIQDAHGSYWAWSPAERAAWDTLAALQPREVKS